MKKYWFKIPDAIRVTIIMIGIIIGYTLLAIITYLIITKWGSHILEYALPVLLIILLIEASLTWMYSHAKEVKDKFKL